MTKHFPSIESLETRIAPAFVMTSLHILSPKLAVYDDVDGDHVTLKVSAGTLTPAQFVGIPGAHGDQLLTLDLSGGGFDKASVTFKVKKVAGGDGLADIGYINSTGHDLGAVTVKGDLGQIDAGSQSATIPALKSLKVASLGARGLTTQQALGASPQSDLKGPVGAIKISGDMDSAVIAVSGALSATLRSVTIGGSLIGGATATSGGITSTGAIGAVKIAHDILGSSASGSGFIQGTTTIKSVTVGGSLVGGDGAQSGLIRSLGGTGSVKIGLSVVGGTGNESGFINSQGAITSVSVGGSLRGSSGNSSGVISSVGDVRSIQIRGDVIGDNAFTANVNSTGVIQSDGDIARVTIGGSVFGGAATGGFAVNFTGVIFAKSFSKQVTIGGSLKGGLQDVNGSQLNSATIYAQNGINAVTIKHNLDGGIISAGTTLGSVTLGGSLIGQSFSGGTLSATGVILSGASMGAVKIGGDIVGGSASSNANLDRSGYIGGFHISSVTVGGSIYSGSRTGTSTLKLSGAISSSTDIGSVKVGGGIIGNSTTPVIISARGQFLPSTTSDIAIGKVTVGGEVYWANMLAGAGVNGDAQIGAVKVGGDWIASNIVAGARNLGADDAVGGSGANADNLNFGDTHDFSLGVGNAQIAASIASITIQGQLYGAPDASGPATHFGFVAEHIGSIKVAGETIAIPTDTNVHAIGGNGAVSVHLL